MMLSSLFAASAILLQASGSQPHIVIDSEFDDWRGIQPVLIDPADAPNSAVDFGEVRICHDDRFVNLEADFGRNVNVQGLDGTGLILLDVDGDPMTGIKQYDLDGVDIIIELSPEHAKSHKREGIALKSTTYQPDLNDPASKPLNIYDIGLMQAPTYAGRRFEFRMNRGAKLPNTPALFMGDHFAGKLVFIDTNGKVVDQTDAFSNQLTADEASKQEEANADPLARAEGTDIRVLAWNVENGGMMSKSDPFSRVFKAIGPDVVLLSEMSLKDSSEQVGAFLDHALPGEGGRNWNVIFGGTGDTRRCAIGTRWPMTACPEFESVTLPNQPNRKVRATGGLVTINDRKVMLVAVHLKCCGRAGGPEDAQRFDEVQAVRSAIKSALATQKVDGLIIAGDFNLVGSRDPLESFAYELDLDGSVMDAPQTLQIDGLSNSTWGDPGQPFAPGRLDYVLYSDSSMRAIRGFSFESNDLGKTWLEKHGLQAGDSAKASDHLPVVVDLRWLPGN